MPQSRRESFVADWPIVVAETFREIRKDMNVKEYIISYVIQVNRPETSIASANKLFIKIYEFKFFAAKFNKIEKISKI